MYKIKNEIFVINLTLVFMIVLLMLHFGYLREFSFYFVKNSLINVTFFIILFDLSSIYTIIQLKRLASILEKEKKAYNNKIDIITSFFIVLGINVGGFLYPFFFEVSSNNFLLTIIFNTSVLFFISFLLLKSVLRFCVYKKQC